MRTRISNLWKCASKFTKFISFFQLYYYSSTLFRPCLPLPCRSVFTVSFVEFGIRFRWNINFSLRIRLSKQCPNNYMQISGCKALKTMMSYLQLWCSFIVLIFKKNRVVLEIVGMGLEVKEQVLLFSQAFLSLKSTNLT